MARTSNPRYFKNFSVTVVGFGNNEFQAHSQLKEQLRYYNSWLRGHIVFESTVEFTLEDNITKATQHLTFERGRAK